MVEGPVTKGRVFTGLVVIVVEQQWVTTKYALGVSLRLALYVMVWWYSLSTESLDFVDIGSKC